MKTRLPTISVVIPCYNVEGLIDSTIQSVLDQTYKPVEILCIDDGSTDGTLRELKNLRDDGAPIYVDSHPNQGASATRNKGLDMASGDYICFLDADDLLEPEKLEHQATLLAQKDTWPDLVAGGSRRVFLDEPERKPQTDSVNPDPWIGLILSTLGTTCSNLWKASFVRSICGWNEDVGPSDDAELMFRMLKQGARVLHDPEIHTVLRRREHSLSNRDKVESARAWLVLRREIYAYLSENELLTEKREEALLRTVFFRLHFLHDEDPAFARKMHRQLIPKDYRPTDPWLGLGRVYNLLYEFFGFSRAERLHRYWLRARSLFA